MWGNAAMDADAQYSLGRIDGKSGGDRGKQTTLTQGDLIRVGKVACHIAPD